MSEYNNPPSRVRFARSNVSGQQPTSLAPGSLAVNWADKKIYVGAPGDVPVLFTQKLEDWESDRAYEPDDFVIFNGDIWRATDNIPPGSSFDPDDWQSFTSNDTEIAQELMSSDIFSGGRVVQMSATSVEVRTGSGVIIDNTNPAAASVTSVNWSTFVAEVPYLSDITSLLAIDRNGVLQTVAASDWNEALRRDHIVLATVLWSSAGQIASVIDTSIRAGGTSETYIDEYQINGGAYRAQGCRPEAVPASLSFSISTGIVFAMGDRWRDTPKQPNRIDISAITPVTFQHATQDGIIAGTRTEVDTALYDNLGILTPLPAGQVSIHYIFAFPDFRQVFVQYGQGVYENVSEAAQQIERDYETYQGAPASQSLILVGAIIYESGITSFDDPLRGRIINARRGQIPFANQSVIDDGNYYFTDGSRAMTGNMDADGNQILNAEIDGGDYPDGLINKIRLNRSVQTGQVPADGDAGDVGEVHANIVDKKIYMKNASGVTSVIADRIVDYADTRQYRVGDAVYYNAGAGAQLYKCTTPITTPEEFNPDNWELIGAIEADSNAVIINPSETGRNTIDVAGEPDVEAIRVIGDPVQTQDLVVIEGTSATDTGALTVNTLGFPGPRFGAASWREAEATHPFTVAGQPAQFDGTWSLGDGSSSIPTVGLVQEIIDDNTFVLRQAGEIIDLDPAAFAGGSITLGSFYYPSDTVPGELTAIPPAGVNAVLLVTGETSGIVLCGNLGASTAKVTIGDTLPDIASATAGDLHYKTERTVGLYIFYSDGTSDQWVQTNGGSGGGGSGTITVGDIFPDNPAPNSLHYLSKGNVGLYVRYRDDNDDEVWVQTNGGGIAVDTDLFVQKAGDTMTGALRINVDDTGSVLNLYRADGNPVIRLYAGEYLGEDTYRGAEFYYVQNDGGFRLEAFNEDQSLRGQMILGYFVSSISRNVTYSRERYYSAVGYNCKSGTNGGISMHAFNYQWTGSAIQAWIDNVNLGTINLTSDDRVKAKNVPPPTTETSLDIINSINTFWYDYTDVGLFKNDGITRFGLSANQLRDIIPEAVNGEPYDLTDDGDIQPMTVDYNQLVVHLVEAVKTLTARVEELENAQ